MLRKPSVIYVLIAAVALSVGLLVYLLDRRPEHSYFLSHGFTFADAPHAWFGVMGNYLPAFLHVYAFILLTVAVAGFSNARLIRIGGAWFVIASLFELGQHPAVSPLIAASLPAWFAHIPLLDNTAAYFLMGTFDPLDFLAIVLGIVAAGLTVVLVGYGVKPWLPGKPNCSIFRYLSLGGTSLVGMLAIIGSGGGEGSFNYGSGDDSLIYVSGNASDVLLIYESANSVSGSTAASRTVAGGNTTLDEPRSITVDMARNRFYVANFLDNSILAFSNARTVSGDVAPGRSISNTVTPISPVGLFIDPISDRLYVTSGNSVLVYDNASGLSGANITPNRTLAGVSTTLNAPPGIFVDTTRNLLYVANAGITNQVLVFSNAAAVDGNIAPARSIPVSSAPVGIFVDVMEDRLYVASGNTIRMFDGASTANSASTPDRTISGGRSMLNQPRDIFVDTGSDRLYVANAADDTVLVFNNASTVNGSPAPNRILNLPAFTNPWGIYVDVTPIVIGSTDTLDGYVMDDGSVNTDPAGGGPKTGDLDDFLGPRLVARQFYSFELTGIPSSVSVQSATLRLYQANVEGSPYGAGNLGGVVVDHVNYDASLGSGDYNVAALTANIGTLSTDASVGYKTLNVTANVASDVLSRSRSQYRLRFSEEINVNFQDDYAQFTDAEDSCCAANRPPQLVITIQP